MTSMYNVKVFLGLCGLVVVGIIVVCITLGDINSNSYGLSSSMIGVRHPRIKNMFIARTDRVREVCAAENLRIPGSAEIKARTWSIEKRHKMLMCRTAKHGSTTWAYNFVKIYSNG